MLALPPQLKHLLVSRAPLALEALAIFARISRASQRAFLKAPPNACRILAYHQTPLESAAAFRRQMEWLGKNRQVVSLNEMVGRIHDGSLNNKRLVTITFDDGFANNYEVAAPILKSLGLSACFFISTDFIDLAGEGPEALQKWQERVYRFTQAAEPMNWDQLRALQAQGFEIGCHTKTHARLAGLPPEALEAEIRDSSVLIRERLGAVPLFFAYPYGKTAFSPPQIRPRVMQTGQFLAAFSTERGWNTPSSPIDWLHRDSMEPSFSPRLLEAFLAGYFDKR